MCLKYDAFYHFPDVKIDSYRFAKFEDALEHAMRIGKPGTFSKVKLRTIEGNTFVIVHL